MADCYWTSAPPEGATAQSRSCRLCSETLFHSSLPRLHPLLLPILLAMPTADIFHFFGHWHCSHISTLQSPLNFSLASPSEQHILQS